MFENLLGGGKLFGQAIAPDMCKLTYKGQIAVKVGDSYKSYNMKTGRLVNQSRFYFDAPDSSFMIWPTTKVKKGDIILVKGKPRCVIDASKNQFTVVNYETSAVEVILPERYVLMGDTYFYAKIVSIYQLMGKGGLGMAVKMSLLGNMFGGNNSTTDNNPMAGMFGGGGNIMQNMLMMQMMGGMFGGDSKGNNLFSSMFDDFDLDLDNAFNIFDSDDADDDDEEEGDSTPVAIVDTVNEDDD